MELSSGRFPAWRYEFFDSLGSLVRANANAAVADMQVDLAQPQNAASPRRHRAAGEGGRGGC
jgi:hypothetical protein